MNDGVLMYCGNTTFPQTSVVKLPPWYKELLTEELIPSNPEDIEKTTRNQYENPVWFKYRANRITASQMHRVVKRKKQPNDLLLNSLFQSKSSTKSAATEYGLSREKLAREKLAKLKSVQNAHLHDCGLIINNAFPFLAATPDGKLCEHGECGIFEIKCPYLARDLSISEACSQIKNFMLKEENGLISINRNHDHYVQVQGQLLVSGAPWCEFIVYTTKDMLVERIFPDVSFMTDMLLKMSFFYKFFAVSFLKKHITCK